MDTLILFGQVHLAHTFQLLPLVIIGIKTIHQKTKEAILGVKIVQKTIDIINELQPAFWFIENPRGKLRKLSVVDWFAYRKQLLIVLMGICV